MVLLDVGAVVDETLVVVVVVVVATVVVVVLEIEVLWNAVQMIWLHSDTHYFWGETSVSGHANVHAFPTFIHTNA